MGAVPQKPKKVSSTLYKMSLHSDIQTVPRKNGNKVEFKTKESLSFHLHDLFCRSSLPTRPLLLFPHPQFERKVKKERQYGSTGIWGSSNNFLTWQDLVVVGLVGFLDHYPHSSLKLHNRQNSHFDYEGGRVAELGSLSSGAKMAIKIFVKCVFIIFATNASNLRVIANLQN